MKEKTSQSYSLRWYTFQIFWWGTFGLLFTTIQQEDYNLGKRYYVIEKSGGTKRVGRVERKCMVKTDYPQYWIVKCSYQEQRAQLWSYLISRLGEVYLIRAEASAMLGQT